MSEKEWEVSYNEYNNTYTVKEAKHYDFDSPPSTDPTRRENLNKKLRNMGKGGKIFLTILFNFYGSLFRFSSNTTIGFICGLLDLTLGKFALFYSCYYFIACIVDSRFALESGDIYALMAFLALPVMILIIDLLSIIKKNDIIFLGNKKYKNYSDYKRK